MSIARASIEKKTITMLCVVIALGGGIWAYDAIGRLEDPNFTIKTAQVHTYYPGATAYEVEQEVTEVVESAAQQMGQIKDMTSSSYEGYSIVEVNIQDQYGPSELPQVWDELRRKINDAQSKLPPGVKPSVVVDDFGDVFGMLYAITGDGYNYKQLNEFAKDLRRELLLVPGVAKVNLNGVQQEIIYVEIPRERLSTLGVSEAAILAALRQQNVVQPSGTVQAGDFRMAIRPSGEVDSLQTIRDLLVHDDAGGKFIRLGDVAKVERGYQDPPGRMNRFNSKPAINMGISMVGDANVVKVGEAVKARLAELEYMTPVGVIVNPISLQGDFVKKSVDGFVLSLVESVIIVVVVLLFFMGLRAGLLIGLVLLLTTTGTLLIMHLWGIQLQRISLGALIIALGMLVDNAIVVTDGIMVRVARGMSKVDAAVDIVKQTIWPLFGATVVAVLAFAGIGLSQDNTGEFCRSLFQVVLISMMLSWVTAITFTPLFANWMLKGPAPKKEGDDSAPAEEFNSPFYKAYKGFLSTCIRKRSLTIAVAVGMLALSIFGFTFIKSAFFPSLDRPQFALDLILPQGTDIAKTQAILEDIETQLKKRDDVTFVSTSVGGGNLRFMLTYTAEDPNPSYGQVMIGVKDQALIDGMIKELQAKYMAKYPQAIVNGWRFMIGTAGGAKIGARFTGPDANVLRELGEQATTVMRADPMAKAIRTDWKERVQTVRPIFSEDKALAAGITRADFKAALNRNFDGTTAGYYREEDNLIPIVSRAPVSESMDADAVQDAQIWSPVAKRMIPMRQVISGVETTFEDGIIARRDRKRTIEAMCDPTEGLTSDLFNRLRPKIEAIPLPDGYFLTWGAEYDSQQKANAGLATKLPVSFLIMIMIVILLFNSVPKAGVVLLSVPFLIVGVTMGLMLTNTPFSFVGLLGFLSLTGMVIKNGIVLVDQIALEIAEGKPRFKAVVESSASRILPVSMGAVTTVLGMIPLLWDIFFKDMAVTIMFGLSFATVLALLIVPVIYAAMFRVRADEV